MLAKAPASRVRRRIPAASAGSGASALSRVASGLIDGLVIPSFSTERGSQRRRRPAAGRRITRELKARTAVLWTARVRASLSAMSMKMTTEPSRRRCRPDREVRTRCLVQGRNRCQLLRGTLAISRAAKTVSNEGGCDPVNRSVMSNVRAKKFAVCVAVMLPCKKQIP